MTSDIGDNFADAIDECEDNIADAIDQSAHNIADAIDESEEILDPLDGLIERAAENPGAPFEPAVLESLGMLKEYDRASFEVLRAGLKKVHCRVLELDKAIGIAFGPAGSASGSGRDSSQSDTLIRLAAPADLFHTREGTGYADINVNGHRETHALRSKGFRRFLAYEYYKETQGAANTESTNSALGAIEAKAIFDSPERLVFTRVGELDGKFYLDLCNDVWGAVEIGECGYRVVDNPLVRFRRSASMKALPSPVAGGSIDELRPFLNLKSSDEFVLVIAFLLAALRPRGPYPVLTVHGEQGSAKTTFCRILKQMVDPSNSKLSRLPREDRDLFIAAQGSHVMGYDNVSDLPEWMSDALCQLSTGASLKARELYTDQGEVVLDAVNPIILNGIEDFVTRGDLADRSLALTLEPIPEENRLSEDDLWATIDAAHPRILGALLEGAVRGLKMLPVTRLKKLPRMADFARWAIACETAFWPSGTFALAYGGNREEAVNIVLDSDPVAIALRAFMDSRSTNWTGTATTLLHALNVQVGEKHTRLKDWPKSAGTLGGQLRRLSPLLRKVGIEIDFKQSGTRQIYIAFDRRASTSSTGRTPAAQYDRDLDGLDGVDAHPAGEAREPTPDNAGTVRYEV
jgi:hypothetical protein